MRKLLILITALVMVLSLAACGGSAPASASVSAVPASASVPASKAPEAAFTADQQALAKEFMEMAAAFDKISDRVNATPAALENQELVTSMNELADEIIKADDYFTSPEKLTPEVMSELRAAIVEVHKFTAVAEVTLDEVDSAAQGITVPVEIVNGTGVDIYALALSPANSDDWGENLIDEVIKNGEKVQGELVFTADTLVWDILVQDSEENQLTFMGVDFSDVSTDGAKLFLDATESGKYVASVN